MMLDHPDRCSGSRSDAPPWARPAHVRRCDHRDLIVWRLSAVAAWSRRAGPHDHAPSITAASSSLGGEELRLVIPVLESVCECDVPVGNVGCKESSMGRGILLWLIGVPIPIIILLYLFGVM